MIEEFVGFGTIAEDIVQAAEGLGGWRARLDDCMRRHRGNKAAAARELGIARQTLYAELGQHARNREEKAANGV